MAKRVQLPVLLSFGSNGSVRIGRGEAGWAVIDCDDLEHARQIATKYPESRTPAWARMGL